MPNKYDQGKFSPKNIKKYKGNPTQIYWRSSWELKLMLYLDKHPDIIYWQSEELSIPYLSPKDNRVHRYFPDFVVKRKNKQGKIETLVIEIKPKKQTMPPKKKKKITQTYINEVMTYEVNKAKWKAAKEYCEDRKYKFLILSEEQLGILK